MSISAFEVSQLVGVLVIKYPQPKKVTFGSEITVNCVKPTLTF